MHSKRCLGYNSVLVGLSKIELSMNIIKKLLKPLFLIIVAFVIIFPRFYQLGSTPHGLHIDEVSFAADAKSLAETGRDTWGVRMPRVFKAFGEYKAPGLTYSMAFWAKLTGEMNNYVARLPSAFAGLTMIVMLVLTIRLLVPGVSPYLLSIIAVVFAYSPWHFDMSRIFYEAFSATAWISISLYFATRQLLKTKEVGKYDWLLMIVTASVAGYYYASLRYVIIAYVIIVTFLMEVKFANTVKRSFLALFLVALVGMGWVGDLFSDVGLNRLYYYQQKANFGSALEIDEKRQFCYLSQTKFSSVSKACYYLWNKPVSKFTGALDTLMAYLGTDFLFVHAISEYGFDSEYGAFLPPLILFYAIGIYFASQAFIRYLNSTLNHTSPAAIDRIFTLFLLLIIVSLIPAIIISYLDMRMALLSLYLISLLISYGIYQFNDYIQTHLNRIIAFIVYISICTTIVFYILQSTTHYWVVFTKSNDLQWTSDSSIIFNYVKTVSSDYDRIIDTALHGPLAPYFFGDLTTTDIQQSLRSQPDALGFIVITKAGKYEYQNKELGDLACEKHGNSDLRKTLVISPYNSRLTALASFRSTTFNGVSVLREVYDLDQVVAYELDHNSSFKTTCTKK